MKKSISIALFIGVSLQSFGFQIAPSAMASEQLFINQIQETSIDIKGWQNFSNTGTPIKIVIVLTGYSSTPDQTDDTPFISASGKRVRDGVIAANFLPFGTKVKIPELFGDKIFIVEDRMASRYFHRIDVWFATRQAARRLGIQETEIEIL